MSSLTSLHVKIQESFRKRLLVFIIFVLLIFVLVIIQLFNLQVVRYKESKLKAKMNMEDYVPILASRGEIYDRNFEKNSKKPNVVVSNRASFNITTIMAKFKDESELEQSLKNLSNLLNIDYRKTLSEIKSKNKWQRVTIVEDVEFKKIVEIASHQHLYPNISWEDVPVRVYNYGSMFSHVVGYIGSITKNEYENLKATGYKYYHKLGKSGIEKKYDDMLRGQDGNVRRIVDVKNRTEGEEVGKEPLSGNNLILTLDYEVQKAAYEALQDHTGTCIVMNAKNGEIISIASKPDYDPNVLISKNNSDVVAELMNDINKPFLNRAIQTKYPPASTFKIITSIAGLEENKWLPEITNFCPGYYILKGYIDSTKYCYKGTAHGRLNLIGAIGESCNVYFYNMGYKIGPTPILKYANDFGLSEKTEIDLPGEVTGFVPSKKWKRKIFGQSWYDGDTVNLAIGQGFVSVTPIAMANLVSGIVNKGVIYKPFVVKEIRSQDNTKIIKRIAPEKLREIPLSSVTIDTVRKGMRLSVTDGTSVRLNSLKVRAAGKTGTAQTRSVKSDESAQHAWFVGYAPYDAIQNDTYVVAVLIERGLAGAATAVPVAQKVFIRMQELGYFDAEIR